MRMVNREMFPVARFNVAERVEQFQRVGVEIHARRRVRVCQRIDFQRAIFFTADNAARFVGRVAPRVGDQLLDLFRCENHLYVFIALDADERGGS